MAIKTNIDLDGLSVQELRELIAAAEAKRAEKGSEAKAALIEEMTQRAAELGLSLQGLMQGTPRAKPGRKPRSDAGKTVAAKYRGPDGQEWTGRGRPPAWLTAAEAQGTHRDDFRIPR